MQLQEIERREMIGDDGRDYTVLVIGRSETDIACDGSKRTVSTPAGIMLEDGTVLSGLGTGQWRIASSGVSLQPKAR